VGFFGLVLPGITLGIITFFPTVVLALKWLFLGRVRPGQHPLWSCWCSHWDFLYVTWDLYARGALSVLEGTPFLPWYLRAMGVHVGKGVVLGWGFAQVVDPDMLKFGDDATVNCMFQAHSFEDRVLKIDRVHIGAGASVCSAAVLFYGAEVGGIQVNFCKNPGCANYGVPARSTIRRGGTGGGRVQDGYELTSASAMTPLLRCHGCGEQPPIKSNIAILEKRTRFRGALSPRKEPSCPDETCAHHGAPVSAGIKFYQSFGLTHSGSRR
jgi:hypothetical protein